MAAALSIANGYGDVDVRQPLSRSYRHVPGGRLQPLCRALRISFARALVGIGCSRYGSKPFFDGVVVSARSARRLLEAIAERERRANDPATVARKKRAKQREERRKAERERERREQA